MDTEELIDAAKKYWPWALGAVAAIWALGKVGGNSSASGTSTASDYSNLIAAQSEAAVQYAAIGMQQQQLQADNEYRSAQLFAEKEIAAQSNYNEFIALQSAMAQSVGSSTAQVIGALNQPALQVLATASEENQAALYAASNVAVAEYQAIADINKSAADTVAGVGYAAGSYADTAGPIMGAVANQTTGMDVANTGVSYLVNGINYGSKPPSSLRIW